MKKSRLEAFSDGVFAILITILVLELRAPHAFTLAALREVLPSFLGYVLSFVFVGIYWNNHHHLLQLVETVDGRVLWANLGLLFHLSLIPFATAWMGESEFAPAPVALYGALLFFAGLSYWVLAIVLQRLHPEDSALRRALRDDRKEKTSLAAYAVATVAAWRWPWISCALFVAIALLWLVPDLRIERALGGPGARAAGE